MIVIVYFGGAGNWVGLGGDTNNCLYVGTLGTVSGIWHVASGICVYLLRTEYFCDDLSLTEDIVGMIFSAREI